MPGGDVLPSALLRAVLVPADPVRTLGAPFAFGVLVEDDSVSARGRSFQFPLKPASGYADYCDKMTR